MPLTNAEKQIRSRARKATREQRYVEALRQIANYPTAELSSFEALTLQAIARKALQGE